MKKLMTIAAAALCASVFADGITSANVVGYQTQTVNGNNKFTWSVATMQQMGKTLEGQTLASFALPKDKEFSGSSSIELQTYGKEGSLTGRYYFLDKFNADIEVSDPTASGWYDAQKYDDEFTWVCCNDTVIPFGSGTMLMNCEEDQPMTFAGQVITDEVAATLNGNNLFTWFGNCSPVAIKLGDVAIPADLGFSGSSSIELQTYGKDGSLTGRYYFLDANNADIEVSDKSATGWYDAQKYDTDFAWVCCNDSVTLEAGQMFMLMSCESDTTISIPSAIKK